MMVNLFSKYRFIIIFVLLTTLLYVADPFGTQKFFRKKFKEFFGPTVYKVYDRYENKFQEVNENLDAMCVDINGAKGIYVEFPFDHFHVSYAILIRYDAVKDHANLFAYNKSKNIALLWFDRWNNNCLNLSAPDSKDYFKHAGLKCSVSDACKLLRIGCKEQHH